MMHLTAYGVMFGGPVLALLALGLFVLPALRPVRLIRTIGWVCACAAAPVGISIASNTGYALLILRPGTAFLGVLVSVAYLVLWRRDKLPRLTVIPPAILLLASLLDLFSVYLMSDPGFAGGSC